MDEESGNTTQMKSSSPKKSCDWFTQKFAELVNLPTFVDKTLFIKAFLQNRHSVLGVLAPKGYGKSINMDMVREFVSGNRKLFEDNKLKIYEEERDFFNKYCEENPVIYVDFKSVGGETSEEVLDSMKTVIQGAYDDHKYLVKEIEQDYSWSDERLNRSFHSVNLFVMYWKKPETVSEFYVTMAFENLSEILHKYHGKPVYVFIDSYDASILQSIVQTNLKNQVLKTTIDLIPSVLSQFFRDGKHVKQALINGCIEISQEYYTVTYYQFLRIFAPYFGFTDDEVRALFQRDEFVVFKNDDEIRNWYSGYRTEHTNIYRSYSIIQYLDRSTKMNKPQFNTYWVVSDRIPNLTEVFTKSEIRWYIEKLINDETVEISTARTMYNDDILTLKSHIHVQQLDFRGNVDIFLRILVGYGYLNAIRVSLDCRTLISVPNEEIKKLLQETCYNALYFEQKYQLRPTKIREHVEALCLLLEQKDKNAFIRFANCVSELFDGALIPNEKDELDSILFTLLYNFKLYRVQNDLKFQRVISRRKWFQHNSLVSLGDVDMTIGIKCRWKSSEKVHDEMLEQAYDTINDRTFRDYRDAVSKIFLVLDMNEDRKVSLTYTVDNSAKQTVTSDD